LKPQTLIESAGARVHFEDPQLNRDTSSDNLANKGPADPTPLILREDFN
jgi:hypothetical protein